MRSWWTGTGGPPDLSLARLTVAQAAGQAGTWAGYTAALPIALADPHPAAALSAITAVWGLPSIAARLTGGAIDRYGPRRIGAAAWALAALAAAMAALVHLSLPGLLVVLAVVAAGGTWGVAAGEAAPTWLPGRPDLAAAGSWLVVAGSVPLALGPVGATNLTAHAGDRATWTLVAALSVVAAVATLAVPATRPPGAARARSHRRVPAPMLAVLTVTAALYASMGVITVLEPLYVRQVLAAPLTVYGWLLAVWAGAGTAVAVLAGRWRRLARAPIWAAVAVTAAGQVLYLGTAVLAAAFAGAALFGAGAALFRLSARAVIVDTIPEGEHGRALSWWETVQCASFAAPAVATGPLVAIVGLRVVLACCGLFTAAVAALAGVRPAGVRPAGVRPAGVRPAQPGRCAPRRSPGPAPGRPAAPLRPGARCRSAPRRPSGPARR
jgi:MFS family permease